MNRATADTAQDTAATEGLAPLMLWVKRLADHVTQDLLGQLDLEFAWGDLTPADPAAQAKIIDTYVRDGVYAVNEARGLLGLDPVPGGDQPMIYGTQGAVPLGATTAAPERLQRGSGREQGPNCSCHAPTSPAGPPSLHKYNPDEPRVPAGNPQGGEWTNMSLPSPSAILPPTTGSSADDKDQQQAFAGELIDQRSDGVETICTYMTPTGMQYSFIVPMGNYACPQYHPAPP